MFPIVRFNRPVLSEDFFRSALINNFFDEPQKSIPAVNISESENNFLIEVAAPGYDKKDFKISFEKDVLTISSEKESKKEEDSVTIRKKEFYCQAFKRSFSLPEEINSDLISASYQNGILTIQIPKMEETKVKSVHQIEVA